MSNDQIVLYERIALMEKGVIGATKKTMTIEIDGVSKKINIPQEIHTFQEWKNLGRIVKRNEKAIATFPIWIHSRKVVKGIDETEQEDHFYLKNSYWFTIEQTEELKQLDDVEQVK